MEGLLGNDLRKIVVHAQERGIFGAKGVFFVSHKSQEVRIGTLKEGSN
jgi:hypothetical protein